jgi:hypothetical protein
MQLKLINLGRNNINTTVTLKKPSYSAVLKEVKKHLGSKYPDIEETADPHIFDIYAGMRCVGQIWVEKPEYMILL